MNRTAYLLTIAAAILGVLLAGCGGPKADQAAAPAAPADEAPATDAAAPAADPDAVPPKPAADAAKTPPGRTVAEAPKLEPAKTVPAKGDASRYKGTYRLVIGERQAKLNAEMEKRGQKPFGGTIEIDGRGGFTFLFGPEGRQRKTEGTTQVEGDTITLTPQLVEGEVPTKEGEKRPLVFKMGSDGKTLEPQGDLRTQFRR